MEDISLDVLFLITKDASDWYKLCLCYSVIARRFVLHATPKDKERIHQQFVIPSLFNNNRYEIVRKWYVTTNPPRLHRLNGPACEIYNINTNELVSYVWIYDGRIHRDNDQPAVSNPPPLLTRICWDFGAGGAASTTIEWWKNGVRHRDGDQPAIIYKDGSKVWIVNGKLHRENDKPAVIRKGIAYGKMYQWGRRYFKLKGMCPGREWWIHGKLHRDNGKPAIINRDGSEEYWTNGVIGRGNDQPGAIGCRGLLQVWFLDGQKHRENDKPALVYRGRVQKWYRHGLKHRDNDQPAIVYDYGKKQWFQNDHIYRVNNSMI